MIGVVLLVMVANRTKILSAIDDNPEVIGTEFQMKPRLIEVPDKIDNRFKGGNPLYSIANARGTTFNEFIESGVFKEILDHGVTIAFRRGFLDDQIPQDQLRIIRVTSYFRTGDIITVELNGSKPKN